MLVLYYAPHSPEAIGVILVTIPGALIVLHNIYASGDFESLRILSLNELMTWMGLEHVGKLCVSNRLLEDNYLIEDFLVTIFVTTGREAIPQTLNSVPTFVLWVLLALKLLLVVTPKRSTTPRVLVVNFHNHKRSTGDTTASR